MKTQAAQTLQPGGGIGSGSLTNHEDRTAVEGLEDLFKWASDMVANGEDGRVKAAREHRIRRQVLEAIQQLREQRAAKKAADEIAYLQRRVMALLQKLNELTEEHLLTKQIMVAQYFSLQRIPQLEQEIKRLSELERDREAARAEQQEFLKALSKLQKERDFLDELLRANEEENDRLARLLVDARAELDAIRRRRWWHVFWPFRS